MNILIDQLPEAVEIDGVEYSINTDYRTAILIMMAFEDEALTAQDKAIIMLRLLYGEDIP